MKTVYVKIDGIHCNHCITKITNELLKNKKIRQVSIRKNIAHISYEGKLSNKELINTITKLDYETNERYISDDLKKISNDIKLKEFIIMIGSILFISFLFEKLLGFQIFNMIPTIDSKITYGMLMVTGFLTSIHCISMCGAINLIAVTGYKRNLKKPIFYNMGRILSYTLIGGLVGFIGSIFDLNHTITGIIILFAAIVMFLMSLSMLGFVEFRLPKFSFQNKKEGRNSFIIGLLNGFMPCGPLQAMQLYALSTGSFMKGALAMFLFGIGTVPLMLSMGLFVNFVKGNKKILINKIASVLILLLSFVMLNRGLLALDIDITKIFHNYDNFIASIIEDGIQTVEFDLTNRYEDIIVQKGIPVRLIIHVDKKYLTGCNNELVIHEFNITKKLEVGENIIEFTPTETGEFVYTCWMNMIKNTIKVIDDEVYFKEEIHE